MLGSLKLVVLGLVIASTHYKVVFLQDSRARLIIPIARIYFKKMANTAVDALLKMLPGTVESVTNGSVVANAHSYDGAHRLLIRDSPQDLAREAIADAANIATGVASEQGAGEATEADAAAGDAPSAPSLQTNLGKAQTPVRLITKTTEMPVCNPNSGPANVPGLVTTERAAERAADAPTGPLLDAAAAAHAPLSQGTRSGGAGAFASSV